MKTSQRKFLFLSRKYLTILKGFAAKISEYRYTKMKEFIRQVKKGIGKIKKNKIKHYEKLNKVHILIKEEGY